MAGGAHATSIEDSLASLGCVLVKAPFWRHGSRDCKLLKMQRRQSRCNKVRNIFHMPESSLSCNGKLCGIVEAGVEEGSFSMH